MNDRSPHMTKLYGDTIRKEAGFVKVFKKVASRNAQRVAKKTTPGMRRVVREVKGTIDKVYEETAEALEEFLARCTYFHPYLTHVAGADQSDSYHQLRRRLRRSCMTRRCSSSRAVRDWSSRTLRFPRDRVKDTADLWAMQNRNE